MNFYQFAEKYFLIAKGTTQQPVIELLMKAMQTVFTVGFGPGTRFVYDAFVKR